MIARRILPALIVAALFAFATHEADAQLYGSGYGCNVGPYGHPYGSSLYSLGRIPVPPYFALHPPVYYSGNETTTYGRTPFARPPHLLDYEYPVHDLPRPPADAQPALRIPAGETQSAATKVVMNPFVGQQASPAEQPVRQPPITRSAQIVENPFIAKARLASAK